MRETKQDTLQIKGFIYPSSKIYEKTNHCNLSMTTVNHEDKVVQLFVAIIYKSEVQSRNWATLSTLRWLKDTKKQKGKHLYMFVWKQEKGCRWTYNILHNTKTKG